MTSPARHLTLLFSLVAVLLAAALPSPVQASPDGDDDNTYNNTGGTFGTQYSSLESGQQGVFNELRNSQPVTDQAPDGSSVTANLMQRFVNDLTRGLPNGPYLRLTRFDINGQPTGFGGDGKIEIDLDDDLRYEELLDIHVLPDGGFVVLIRATDDDQGDRLVILRFDADGTLDADDTLQAPEACFEKSNVRGDGEPIAIEEIKGYISAGRTSDDGAVSALWDCYIEDESPPRGTFVSDRIPAVAQYDAGSNETDSVLINGDYGEDLEFGPNGDPYALVAGGPTRAGRGGGDFGQVYQVPLSDDGDLTEPEDDPFDVPGNPIDLAVDSQGRSLVWTREIPLRGFSAQTWDIYRLVADRSALDTTWGNSGKATVSDPRLGIPRSGGDFQDDEQAYLTVRPGDKILASDGYRQQDTEEKGSREANAYNNGMIAGLTNTGQTDTGFASAGFKVFEYAGGNRFDRIGEPTLQSDGKVLIPHTNGAFLDKSNRITSPPDDEDQFIGVTRLNGSPSQVVTQGSPPGPVRPSATPTICGRRAISLVRADVKGNKVKLTGLVGAALYGKKVTIQTDPKGARNSKFTKTGTVTASKTTGAFTATVPRPKKADFISVRYRAVSGTARSPSLKLPQRLTSRSVKSAKNTITVKGKVKKSVLGKRNKVLIRRLVCGRYRTVGSARPDANGNYTVTFASTQIRGVAFYRAEAKVLRKAGSKKYVIQYARAIAIRTTSQTG